MKRAGTFYQLTRLSFNERVLNREWRLSPSRTPAWNYANIRFTTAEPLPAERQALRLPSETQAL